MKTGKMNCKSWSRVGPGGWNCVCCGSAPKHRTKFARLHKRRMYRELDKLDKE